MLNSPRFTVIIPTYNRPIYTRIAIDSVLVQSFMNYEIIITDDSTNEEIFNLVKDLNEPKIKYYKNERRLGIAENVKKAILYSTGSYIAILNDDDFWHPEWLESVSKKIEYDNNLDLVFCDHWLVDINGQCLYPETEKNTITYLRSELDTSIDFSHACNLYINNTVPIAVGSVFRKSILDLNDFPNEIGGAYDRWIMMNILSKTKSVIYYIPTRLTYYRIHSSSVTSTQRTNTIIWLEYVMNKSIGRFKNTECNQKIISLHRNILKTLTKALFLDRNYFKAIVIFYKYILSIKN